MIPSPPAMRRIEPKTGDTVDIFFLFFGVSIKRLKKLFDEIVNPQPGLAP